MPREAGGREVASSNLATSTKLENPCNAGFRISELKQNLLFLHPIAHEYVTSNSLLINFQSALNTGGK